MSPALPADHPFLGVQFLGQLGAEAYWSSTTRADFTTAAIPVFFLAGYTSITSSKANPHWAWPVRGGR